MAKARATKKNTDRSEDVARERAATTPPEETSVEASDLLDDPVDPEDLANPVDGDSMPTAASDEQAPDSLEGMTGDGLGADLSSPKQPDADELGAETIEDLDDLVVDTDGVGGLDGRGFDGGGSSNIGGPGYNDGLEDGSAAGALPAHQQAVIDNYAAQAQEAAANGDYAEAARIGNEAANFMREIQGLEPVDFEAAEAEQETSIWDDFWGDAGDAGKGFGVVGGLNKEQAEAAGITDVEKKELEVVKTEVENLLDEEDSGQDATGSGVDDYDESAGLGGSDPWQEFTDSYFEGKREADAGADIDPGPDGGFDVAPEMGELNYTDTVAQYEEGAVVATYDVDDEFPEPDMTPDEEFYDV